MSFSGEAAKTKKQAEKNAAIAAWSAFKRMPNLGPLLEQQCQENASRTYTSSRAIRRRDESRGRIQRPNQRDNNKQPWKFPDPFLETKHNAFLPPPPPNWSHRPATDLAPPKLTAQREDYEWTNKISSSYIYGGKQGVYSKFGTENRRNLQQWPLFKIQPTCHNQVGLLPKIAPAVQIRSVVPVCAAPPVRPSPSQSPSSSSSSSVELASTLGKLKL